MFQPGIKAQRLGALFLLGCLLFNYPLLQLFARGIEVAGIPVLYIYIFSAWGMLIGLISLVAESRSERAQAPKR
jgi:hypothetical protein